MSDDPNHRVEPIAPVSAVSRVKRITARAGGRTGIVQPSPQAVSFGDSFSSSLATAVAPPRLPPEPVNPRPAEDAKGNLLGQLINKKV